MYKAKANISADSTIVIDGNAELADSVTEQIDGIIVAGGYHLSGQTIEGKSTKIISLSDMGAVAPSGCYRACVTPSVTGAGSDQLVATCGATNASTITIYNLSETSKQFSLHVLVVYVKSKYFIS